MKQQKVDLSPKELFKNFKEGTPDKIKTIAVYCIMDCKLGNDLINKLQVITNNLGMSNVCVVPFSYLFLRGQGIKIFSLVAKFCNEENFLIKDLSPDDIGKNSYEGAIVFVPTPGVYFEPVVVMDYNSLYPSSMIAENISHDSIVGYKEYSLKQKTEYEVVSNLLKDSGIKARIIKKYIPVINKLINKYLTSMDFYVNFTLDEEFNEVIKSRYRDVFSYASFSEGDKQKIDLALLFTWREIAHMKNSVSTNLLLLDEVFDSSLDASATEDLLKILKNIDKNTNVFVISHKGDILVDKFINNIKFDKVSDFSKIISVEDNGI